MTEEAEEGFSKEEVMSENFIGDSLPLPEKSLFLLYFFSCNVVKNVEMCEGKRMKHELKIFSIFFLSFFCNLP